MQLDLDFFKRHTTSTFFFVAYYVWISFVINFFTSGSANYPHSCGAANGAIIVLTVLMIVLYSIALVIKMLLSRGSGDYGIFLGLVFMPLLAAILFAA